MVDLHETLTDERLKQAMSKFVVKFPVTTIITNEQGRPQGVQTNYAN